MGLLKKSKLAGFLLIGWKPRGNKICRKMEQAPVGKQTYRYTIARRSRPAHGLPPCAPTSVRAGEPGGARKGRDP
ncbi:unnamed protein product [Boreogadus saida]